MRMTWGPAAARVQAANSRPTSSEGAAWVAEKPTPGDLKRLWRKSLARRRGAKRRRGGGGRGGSSLPAKDGGTDRASDSGRHPVGKAPRIRPDDGVPHLFEDGFPCGALYPRAVKAGHPVPEDAGAFLEVADELPFAGERVHRQFVHPQAAGAGEGSDLEEAGKSCRSREARRTAGPATASAPWRGDRAVPPPRPASSESRPASTGGSTPSPRLIGVAGRGGGHGRALYLPTGAPPARRAAADAGRAGGGDLAPRTGWKHHRRGTVDSIGDHRGSSGARPWRRAGRGAEEVR